ncbi:MAG: hypothetical protein LBI57_07355 [Helicobacteraceae bacterium]|jgi:phosphatidylserine decarboxylase|nr:hypothetical protein [Helicobacteraceae bacterium]
MKTLILAREGFAVVFVLAIAPIAAIALDLEPLATILALAFMYNLWFFRNPERIPDERDAFAFTAPIDGKITDVEGEGGFAKITIETGIFDARLIRSPIQTKELALSITHGIEGADGYLTQTETLFFGATATLTMAPAFKSSRFYRGKNGSYLGERLGFFYGGKAIITLPKDSDIKVAIGGKVKAGETALGFARS